MYGSPADPEESYLAGLQGNEERVTALRAPPSASSTMRRYKQPAKPLLTMLDSQERVINIKDYLADPAMYWLP